MINLSEHPINLLELIPRPAMIVDSQTHEILYQNQVCKSTFSIPEHGDSREISTVIPHTPSPETIYTALMREMEAKGKAILHHVSMSTAQRKEAHYDIHISFADGEKKLVYLIFALSDHALQRMVQQNTYYDAISKSAYAYPFHLDVKSRRMEFFDPALENEFHMTMVMEDYPNSVFDYDYIYPDDVDDFLQVADRMYKGLPPEGSFRFYNLQGEPLRYTVNYVVNRDESGAPITVVGDFIIQSETKFDMDSSILIGGEQVALAHQIKPHFFFNTLNSISALCKQDAAKADRAICTFASYMRSYMYLINESEMIPFQQEIALIKSTLELEKLRFPNNFVYQLDLGEMDFDIPPLTVQPIVENALLHGLRRTGHHGRLNISTAQAGDAIVLTVTDDGLGFDTNILDKTQAIGLKSLTRRIETMAGGTVTVQSQLGQGTQVVVTLPI